MDLFNKEEMKIILHTLEIVISIYHTNDDFNFNKVFDLYKHVVNELINWDSEEEK